MPGKVADNGATITTYEFPQRPVKKTLGKIIYDSEQGKLFGRTPTSWAQLFLFYAIFYIVLAALFSICMQVLFTTLNDDHPKWQLGESLIGTNPGLGFRPMPERVEQGSLIWYHGSNKTEVDEWVEQINRFLNPYTNRKTLDGGGKNQDSCDFQNFPKDGNVCAVDVTNWAPCTAEQGYNYNRSSPCIFLKLNRIYGWKPEYYDDPNDLPSEMPSDLVDHIKSLAPTERKQIWVSCSGENTSDNEGLGPIAYIPSRGFPHYFYPYMNVPGYLSPLVAVRFERPKLNLVLNIECRAWAKNILYRGGRRDRQGSIHFELMID